MNILYIDYNMYGKQDIIDAFTDMGHSVDITDLPIRVKEADGLEVKLDEFVSKRSYDIVFTSDYYPVVSNVCQKNNIKYISWTYDSPLVLMYHPSIKNSCNYAFTFDSDECRCLRAKGAERVYYMPLSVNAKRLESIQITQEDKKRFSADVSMVASLYNEKHNLYDRMVPKLTDYTRGYLEAAMTAQKNLFGGFILEDILKQNRRVLAEMVKAMPYDLAEGSLASLEYVYANYFLSRKTASMQRLEYIGAISKRFDMKVYSPGDLSGIPNAKHMGTVDYLTDMNKVFKLSRINLNITLPSIHTGIPLRVMDILGNGGFLLTNYQADLFDLFEPDKEFVYYTSLDDAIHKIEYYLSHEDERKQIAENARQKMKQCFTFHNQLEQILEMAMEDSVF